MKFGVREICDVVLKAKAIQKVGNKVFYKDEPVIYFDSLKTSSMEGAATTVYAQGGRGNSRLIAWEGERTVTFTMEDALLTPESFAILSGAGIVEASETEPIHEHVIEQSVDIEYSPSGAGKYLPTWTAVNTATATVNANTTYYYKEGNTYIIGNPERFQVTTSPSVYAWREKGTKTAKSYYTASWASTEPAETVIYVYVSQPPYSPVITNDEKYKTNYIYISRIQNGEVITEPFLTKANEAIYPVMGNDTTRLGYKKYRLTIPASDSSLYTADFTQGLIKDAAIVDNCTVLVDYYVEKFSGTKIDITPDKFGGNFYLEGSTLFRDTNGTDLPARFTIPNCNIQSNFTFTMASNGDPSTFTFTLDAFPDYTRFNKTKKVLASIQILEGNSGSAPRPRTAPDADAFLRIAEEATRDKTWSAVEPND